MATGSSGSATGNPRNKVALKPGHSLMDWIRLGNSGKDLTGVGGVQINVTKAQLAEHKSKDDAWLCIRGIVYNVTHYMDFHPGGCEELMRGVGIDATSLFNQVHAWVNYQSILQKCVVGRLGSSSDENVFSENSSSPTNKSSTICNAIQPKSSSPMSWSQQQSFVTIMLRTNVETSKVHIMLKDKQALSCKIGDFDKTYKLQAKVHWPGHMSTDGEGKVQLTLMKKCPVIWKDNGITADTVSEKYAEYWPAKVTAVVKETHDSCMIRLQYLNDMYNFIGIGRHIRIKKDIKAELSRPYTPVPMLPIEEVPMPGDLRDMSEEVNLLVKAYPDGQISEWLCTRKPGDSVFVSNPMGEFTTNLLKFSTVVYLLAAGTGITPMVSVATWILLTSSSKQVKLLYFNKTMDDIIWKEKFDQLQKIYNGRFSVEHILSHAGNSWTGRSGHVSLNMLKEIIVPQQNSENPHFVCVCGPKAYTMAIEKWLKEDLEYPEHTYFMFYGNK